MHKMKEFRSFTKDIVSVLTTSLLHAAINRPTVLEQELDLYRIFL